MTLTLTRNESFFPARKYVNHLFFNERGNWQGTYGSSSQCCGFWMNCFMDKVSTVECEHNNNSTYFNLVGKNFYEEMVN